MLVIGSGAREHALARALLRGDATRTVVVAPGNAGIAGERLARRAVDTTDGAAVVALAREIAADLVVIGPEAPLCAGVSDALATAGFATFGPSRAAAQLEGSKAFLKAFAARHGIPTARFDVCTDLVEARRIIEQRGAPIVIKASGLCAGKGVVVAATVAEALDAAEAMLGQRVFGEAGATIVIEDCIAGREVSLHALSDGERFVVLPPARDHKRVGDGDRGPNTGGMGVVCPLPDVSPELLRRITEEAIAPTIRGMRDEGTPFRGVLFAGLMVDPAGKPWLLEHNVRFGDPECEALMELVTGDLGLALRAAAEGALDPSLLEVAEGRHAVVVVLAAAGYPESPRSGDPIEGLTEAEALGAKVHHAGTKTAGDAIVTSGGRVLAVTASADSPEEARAIAYRAAEAIVFSGKHFRRDIGAPRSAAAS